MREYAGLMFGRNKGFDVGVIAAQRSHHCSAPNAG